MGFGKHYLKPSAQPLADASQLACRRNNENDNNTTKPFFTERRNCSYCSCLFSVSSSIFNFKVSILLERTCGG